jgi:hypothetical protein
MWEMMGKWIKYTHIVVKCRNYKPDPNFKVTHPAQECPGTGMIIGRRWLKDGHVSEEIETGEYGTVLDRWQKWTPDDNPSIPVYVIVKNDRSNPIWVSPDGIDELEVG